MEQRCQVLCSRAESKSLIDGSDELAFREGVSQLGPAVGTGGGQKKLVDVSKYFAFQNELKTGNEYKEVTKINKSTLQLKLKSNMQT